jgi:hypothetical protein
LRSYAVPDDGVQTATVVLVVVMVTHEFRRVAYAFASSLRRSGIGWGCVVSTALREFLGPIHDFSLVFF